VETVSVRLTATKPFELPDLSDQSSNQDEPSHAREANFDGDWIETPVLQRSSMTANTSIEGPCIVEFAEATAVVRPGWSGAVDSTGTLVVNRQ
jgi:N-methylhydantoinase A